MAKKKTQPNASSVCDVTVEDQTTRVVLYGEAKQLEAQIKNRGKQLGKKVKASCRDL